MRSVVDTFEWDEGKRALVREKHGIDFADAARVFDRPHLSARSDRDGEIRWIVVGVCNGVNIVVIVTRRGAALRLVTARKARRNEREAWRAAFPDVAVRDGGPD